MRFSLESMIELSFYIDVGLLGKKFYSERRIGHLRHEKKKEERKRENIKKERNDKNTVPTLRNRSLERLALRVGL